MKKIKIVVFLMVISISAFSQKEETKVLLVANSDSLRAVSYTLKALTVIDGKCLGCHNPMARNEKSRNALQWELLQGMDATDAYAKLDAISEVLSEGSMPPAKIVEKYPGMKLSDEESATLKEWVEATLSTLEND